MKRSRKQTNKTTGTQAWNAIAQQRLKTVTAAVVTTTTGWEVFREPAASHALRVARDPEALSSRARHLAKGQAPPLLPRHPAQWGGNAQM